MQHTSIDLVNYNADIEKDKCLEHFFSIAKKFQKKVESLGFWMDFIDPCSGLPMLTSDCNKPFDEVQSAQTLLSEKGFSVMNAGCCKILLHPKWGSSVYPTSMFTNADSESAVQCLSELFRDEK
jgi:hypothetical protein